MGATDWQDTAIHLIKRAIEKGGACEDEQFFVIAAKAFLAELYDHQHPSYLNTAFAIAAFMPASDFHSEMEQLAFDLLMNGLAGYFQWHSHNGGTFSVARALVHTGVLTAKEAKQPEQFEVCCTHEGCQYVVLRDDFLARITKRWNLPIANPVLGGDPETQRVFNRIDRLKNMTQRYPKMPASDGAERIRAALCRL